jgi:hypothetical protein
LKRNLSLTGGVAALVVAMSGCALQTPAYQVSIENIDTLKKTTTQPAKVGTFAAKAGTPAVQGISMRGSTLSSSVGGDYGAYLREALRQELELAKRLNASADLEISGELLNTDVDTGVGKGFIDARFVVTQKGQIRFDKVKHADLEWETSFAAAIALPRAQQNYPLIVQRLLTSLYADVDFQNALK